MKAVVYTQYGPPEVLHLEEVAKPVPKANELLIKIHATTVAAGDCRTRAFNVPWWSWLPARLYLGLTKPKRSILGMELAGEIEAVGEAVTRFKPGDRVFAFAGFDFGAYAEYKCLAEEGPPTKAGIVAIMPANLTYEEAAAVPVGGFTALAFLRQAGLQRGQKVLIYGASGSVGAYAVQLASHHWEAEVTGVCSTANLDLVKSLGADAVIDYTQEDFAQRSESYDVVFDAVGKSSRAQCAKALETGGVLLSVTGSPPIETGDLAFLKGLLEAGKLKPVIDRTYPLTEIVDAHRYVDRGHKRGNVVITVGHAEPTA
jgi:NADPH:quinone reductase-like Zn-dependent oxidoreductase